MTALVAAFGVDAAAEPGDMQIIYTLTPPAKACRPENTEAVPLKILVKDEGGRAGKCVVTEGYTTQRALFMNRRDLFLKRASSNGTSARRRIGFYGDEAMMKSVYELDGKRIRATGLLFDCADIGAPGDLVLGYCHYSGGPIIALTAVERVK
jgi:hypothetical protein